MRWRTLLPNGLSSLRIALACVFPWVPPDYRAFVVMLAALTDLVDGEASRLFHAQSDLGRILDPIADKIFLLAVLGTLLWEGQLSWWEIVLLSLRDVLVLLGAALWLVHSRGRSWKEMYPRLLGKCATGLQLIYLAALLVGYTQFTALLFWPTVAVSAAAGLDYWYVYVSRSGNSAIAATSERET
ncbi:MAG: CDP-alcohol phosphatidyltransferase family protein [Gemmataceae bacterium]|nr:CDP-alcohol phosphatidyltransferase family protein [Gemmataceae bacterium]